MVRVHAFLMKLAFLVPALAVVLAKVDPNLVLCAVKPTN